MTKEVISIEEMANFMSEKLSMTKSQAKNTFYAFCDYMHDALLQQKSFRLPKIGVFSVVKSKPREFSGFGGNVIKQGEVYKLKFTTSSVIKGELKSQS